jgi:hypothetical protein
LVNGEPDRAFFSKLTVTKPTLSFHNASITQFTIAMDFFDGRERLGLDSTYHQATHRPSPDLPDYMSTSQAFSRLKALRHWLVTATDKAAIFVEETPLSSFLAFHSLAGWGAVSILPRWIARQTRPNVASRGRDPPRGNVASRGRDPPRGMVEVALDAPQKATNMTFKRKGRGLLRLPALHAPNGHNQSSAKASIGSASSNSYGRCQKQNGR